MGGTDAGAYQILANSYGFRVDIPECPTATKNIREIQIDELNIDARETTTGADTSYRIYGPGAVHWGTARFTSACPLGGALDLKAWYDNTVTGKAIRKNILVSLHNMDKQPGRSYVLYDCFPINWSAMNFDTSSTVQTETVTVSVGRIEFKL